MKKRAHILIPLAALLFQALPILFIRGMAWLTFGPPQILPETWLWTASIAGLGVCAAVSLALAAFGACLLLRRTRPAAAAVGIALCCLPAFLSGAVYLHALLVFLTFV